MANTSGLLRCTKNLKECIDWVLRATGRDLKGSVKDINNLNKALEAELGSFDSNDLTQLVQGLCLFMGYPSCLCKPKKSVKESLKKISKELKEDLKNYKCLSKLDLNCSSCKSLVVCKCCVLDCISKVLNCGCVQGSRNDCSCSKDDPKRCCKDLLEKLKASLSLLNLRADMEKLCTCPDDCCVDGVCTGGSSKCPVCSKLKTPKDYTITGLGLLRPSPIRLAKRLETFFGSSGKPKGSCSCKCGTSGQSCCCLACPGECSQACSCVSSGSCSHGSSQGCPCKEFCIKIDGLKVPSNSVDMTCCESGTKCHCQVDTPKCSGSPNCCDQKKKVKCMIRRLVSYFKSLEISSDAQIKNFKNCCELMCVLKTCEFLKGFLTKGKCGKCKPGSGCSSSGTSSCCKGNFSTCASDPNCCLGCQECCALKFQKAFNDLRFAGPCGQELWRTLDSFLNFIRYVFYPRVRGIQTTLQDKSNGHAKNCKCKSGSCTCASGTSCPGCTETLKKLQDHKDVLGLMTQGYSSAYSSEASWTSLTSSGSGSKCCGSSSCSSCLSCSSGSLCDPSKCCPDCPQRKAAKIFLGMLPCLYWGLKIVFDRCKYGSDFPTWYLRKITEGSIGKFLKAWGFESSHLSSKNASGLPPILDSLFGSGEDFEKLYENCKIYFTSFSSRSSPVSQNPQTVRQMLLWLYGLRFHKHFSDLVLYCSSLCSPFGNSFHPDAFCYYIYTCCFLLPVAIISSIQDSDSAQKVFSSSSSPEWKSFSYPEDPFKLFETFCDFVRKIYIALTFLKFQCKLIPSQAGWQNCWYGKSCKTTGTSSSPCCSTADPSSQGYLCTASGSNQNVHGKHCGSGQCINANGGSCKDNNHNKSQTKGNCKPCPHPLQRFLCDSDSPFRLPSSFARIDFSQTPPVILDASSEILTMGFKTEQLPSTAKSGYDLGHVLHVFCDDGFYPLTRLLEFCLYISLRPPSTLLELLTFFREFISSDVFTSKFASYVDGEPGTFLGEYLRIAVQRLFNHRSHSADLKSLYDCSSTKPLTCGKYLFPLYNVDGVFDKKFLGLYLSFVCHLAPKLKALLEKFKKDFSKSCEHCSSGSCQKIVECPCALPFLYSWGFQFHSPKILNSKAAPKKCSDFVSQLGLVVNGQPFKDLLRIIDAFLWHIRLPFIYAFLYIWILVISYFYYVQFYKLDLLHIDSHLHLPRSFKILPSTLFS
ncbi:variant erythrocyte surface antigen-1 family protein, partial [Babesia divergens]